jgi:retinol dehydrogenase 12
VHPGIIRTNLQRHQSPVLGWVLEKFFKPARYGAYSELFAAVSPDVTLEGHNGDFIIPWGRFGPIPRHIQASLRPKDDAGGTGVSARFWDWVEAETAEYREA